MANTTNTGNNLITVKPLHYWTYKVLPLVYDDSLSYLEILSKAVYKLNQLIQNNNKLPELIKEAIAEGGYLDNLQEQIASLNDKDSKTATADRYTGQLIWLNGDLYRITRNMLAGDQYTLSSEGATGNIEKLTFEDFTNRFREYVKEGITANDEGYNTIAVSEHSVGSLLWWQGILYRVTTAIPINGDIDLRKLETISIEELLNETNTQLQSNIDAEALARQNADAQLQNNIDAEALARQNADAQLQNNIDAETLARQNADAQLQNNIDTEIASRKELIDKDTDGNTEIKSTNDIEISATKNLTSTIGGDKSEAVTGNTELNYQGNVSDYVHGNKVEHIYGTSDKTSEGDASLTAPNLTLDITNPIKYGLPATLNDYFKTLQLTDKNGQNYNLLVQNDKTENIGQSFSAAMIYNVDDYGAVGDGTTDNTQSINNAINAMNDNGILYFPAKNYSWDSPITVTKPITIWFNNTTVECNAEDTQFTFNTSNVYVYGKATFNGAENRRMFLLPNNFNTFLCDLDCTVNGFVNYGFITGERYDHIKVTGSYVTEDSIIVIFNGCSNVEVSGIYAKYTKTPTLGAIVLTDDVKDHTYSNVYIHNNYIDGGNVLNNGAITITRSEQTDSTLTGNNFKYITNVLVSHNITENCPNPTDGLDVLFCNLAVISDNIVFNCFEGIAILATVCSCTNNTIANCKSAGICIGDLAIGSNGTNWTSITVSNCCLINNGTSDDSNAIKASFASDQPDTCYVASIYVTNCLMIGAAWGAWFGSNTGGSNIVFSDCFLYGTTGAFRYIAGTKSMYYVINCPGMTPSGNITDAPDVTTETITNNEPFDCVVYINNGETAQTISINGLGCLYLPASTGTSIYLPKNMQIKLEQTEGVTWYWFGV